MKETIKHLPKAKGNELERITSVIRSNCGFDLEMLILFGSYARGDYKVEADLKPDRRSGHASDYDILAVPRHRETVADSRLWHEITDACRALKPSAHPRIIVHDIHFLNRQLSDGHYFFTDIKKDGCMLFNSHEFKLENKRNLTPLEKQGFARKYFKDWFKRSQGFFAGYEFYLDRKDYALAAFILHQAAEHAYKTILLVFTNYVPNEHWLIVLSDLVVPENVLFADIFPRKTQKEKNRFDLLDCAYISARYSSDFKIPRKDLEILSLSVKKLLELTEKICKRKIKSFTK